ncbi:hypothetical protein VTN77DRAFT_8571 [Rasamsonia byssochlamydoides]|uniref:uncharacterized protein n=1 Tax=Rasamsonia byssochlamydoides TaxID=89139 RepID=UPI003744372A
MRTLPRSPAVLSPLSTRTSILSKISTSRCFHSSVRLWAIAHPITAHGPPPKAPVPAPEFDERRKKQAELIEQGKEARTQPSKPSTTLKKRFWKDVHVKETPDGYQVLLDSRPLRTPAKTVLTIPPTKHHLAEAIALEWDLLTSARQALKQHLIPLTSLTARAQDIAREDQNGKTEIRQEILRTAMRYLDTDTLLCWVPEKKLYDPEPLDEAEAGKRNTLRDTQMRVAQEIIGFLTQEIWPGIEVKPVLDADSIMPVSQPEATIDAIRAWILDLPAYELAALERGVLAAKSLLVAVRLVVEWSEHFRHLQRPGRTRFGVEEAAEAASLEVRHQTDMWGEVEDSHDVDREDLRRQLGSVVLLVSGETR